LPSEKPLLRLYDILENIDRIRHYTENHAFEHFSEDPKCQDAVERCLMRISEAARKLEGIVDLIAPDQPWSDIRSVGNVLRHEYDIVDSAVIWQIVEKDLVPLSRAVEKAIAILRDGDTKPDVT
jgi:uncharacterized protein with HEPN domain